MNFNEAEVVRGRAYNRTEACTEVVGREAVSEEAGGQYGCGLRIPTCNLITEAARWKYGLAANYWVTVSGLRQLDVVNDARPVTAGCRYDAGPAKAVCLCDAARSTVDRGSCRHRYTPAAPRHRDILKSVGRPGIVATSSRRRPGVVKMSIHRRPGIVTISSRHRPSIVATSSRRRPGIVTTSSLRRPSFVETSSRRRTRSSAQEETKKGCEEIIPEGMLAIIYCIVERISNTWWGRAGMNEIHIIPEISAMRLGCKRDIKFFDKRIIWSKCEQIQNQPRVLTDNEDQTTVETSGNVLHDETGEHYIEYLRTCLDIEDNSSLVILACLIFLFKNTTLYLHEGFSLSRESGGEGELASLVHCDCSFLTATARVGESLGFFLLSDPRNDRPKSSTQEETKKGFEKIIPAGLLATIYCIVERMSNTANCSALGATSGAFHSECCMCGVMCGAFRSECDAFSAKCSAISGKGGDFGVMCSVFGAKFGGCGVKCGTFDTKCVACGAKCSASWADCGGGSGGFGIVELSCSFVIGDVVLVSSGITIMGPNYTEICNEFRHKYNINHYSSFTELKANEEEKEYNNTKHSSIGMKPIEVNKNNDKILILPNVFTEPKLRTKYKVGNVSLCKKYLVIHYSKFSELNASFVEIFKHRMKNKMWKNFALNDSFYEYDIMKTNYPDEYLVENVLKIKVIKFMMISAYTSQHQGRLMLSGSRSSVLDSFGSSREIATDTQGDQRPYSDSDGRHVVISPIGYLQTI
ncbi:hypothetical protein PR048_005282 [Dryococelus australis]|uniref:Uncharacterized protein n=1 Tax=Dryococelus australis TaxID=614101 RepID=A0ABQ9I8N8_9NEOP|nr:hypothetical protein PR048_005282 [Dryococelus australis]